MKALLYLLGLIVAVPAYAGHGTIEETDERYVVEWSGDASEKAPDAKQKVQSVTAVAPVKQQVAAVPEQVESKRQDLIPPPLDDSGLRRSRRLRNPTSTTSD